ncbi:MAG: iron-sulfur cluster assembly scaffold protein [Desulfobacterales bacterium]
MNDQRVFDPGNTESIHEMLSGSGYSDKAIRYYMERPYMGNIEYPDQVSELTGHCGDTMKIFFKLDDADRIQDVRYQVLGCPGAIAAAMAAVDLVKGKTLDEAKKLTDRDVFRLLEDLPDQKQHCIRLAVKTLQKAIDEYIGNNGNKKSMQGDTNAIV